MEQHERQMIDDLFAKLKQAEQQSGTRDRNAEQTIAEALRLQPAAPYYMAQVILVQDHAMQAQAQRIDQLEKELAERPAASGGGSSFLGGLFGGGSGQSVTAARPAAERTPVMEPGTSYATQGAAQSRGWGNPAPMGPAPVSRGFFGQGQPGGGGGGGFLSSALTTAAGVAGGVMLASTLGGLFGSHEAKAAEPAAAREPAPTEPNEPEVPDDTMMDDAGDFDTFGDF